MSADVFVPISVLALERINVCILEVNFLLGFFICAIFYTIYCTNFYIMYSITDEYVLDLVQCIRKIQLRNKCLKIHECHLFWTTMDLSQLRLKTD